MRHDARLEPGKVYDLAHVAPLLGLSIKAMQARLRRAAHRGGGSVVQVTPWIVAFRFCEGREWRFRACEPSTTLAEP
jgi:hypothetical protein